MGSQTIDDALTMAAFLFNLEADKGYGFIYGGRKLGTVVDAFCRFTKIERPIWEEIVWPRTKSTQRPTVGKGDDPNG